MAGQGMGRQRVQCREQGAWLSDQLPVQNIGERTLDTVVDGAPTGIKQSIYTSV